MRRWVQEATVADEAPPWPRHKSAPLEQMEELWYDISGEYIARPDSAPRSPRLRPSSESERRTAQVNMPGA
jgi:hypothetical protein